MACLLVGWRYAVRWRAPSVDGRRRTRQQHRLEVVLERRLQLGVLEELRPERLVDGVPDTAESVEHHRYDGADLAAQVVRDQGDRATVYPVGPGRGPDPRLRVADPHPARLGHVDPLRAQAPGHRRDAGDRVVAEDAGAGQDADAGAVRRDHLAGLVVPADHAQDALVGGDRTGADPAGYVEDVEQLVVV